MTKVRCFSSNSLQHSNSWGSFHALKFYSICFLIILIISLLLSFHMSCFQSALCVFAGHSRHGNDVRHSCDLVFCYIYFLSWEFCLVSFILKYWSDVIVSITLWASCCRWLIITRIYAFYWPCFFSAIKITNLTGFANKNWFFVFLLLFWWYALFEL